MTRVLFLRAVALCVSMTSGLVPRISLRTRRGLISGRGVKSARVSAVTSASAVDAATLPPALRSLAAELRSLPDDKYRYKQLLYWAAEYPPLADKLKTDENKVPGCLSTVHISASMDAEGLVHFLGDSDGMLTKGLVVMLVRGLSGATPEQIALVEPGLISNAGIAATLTPGRNNGFVNMLKVIKAKAAALANGSAGESAHDAADAAPGALAREVRERLALLQPQSVELVDDSAATDEPESDMTLTVVAECFEDLAEPKRETLVYTILGDIVPRIRALRIVAKAPSEITNESS